MSTRSYFALLGSFTLAVVGSAASCSESTPTTGPELSCAWGCVNCHGTYTGDILDGGVWVEMPACNEAIDVGRIVVDGQEAFVVDTAWRHLRWLARPAKPVQRNVLGAISNTPAQRIEVREFESTTPPDDVSLSVLITKDASSRVILPA